MWIPSKLNFHVEFSFLVSPTDAKCKECESEVSDENRQNYEDVMDMTKQALEEMQNTRYIDVCRNLDKKQQKVLHDKNIWRLKTLDLAFDAAIDFESWAEAVEFGKKFVEGLKWASYVILSAVGSTQILLPLPDSTPPSSTLSWACALWSLERSYPIWTSSKMPLVISAQQVKYWKWLTVTSRG